MKTKISRKGKFTMKFLRSALILMLAALLCVGSFVACNDEEPTEAPTSAPTEAPTSAPTEAPTSAPTEAPTADRKSVV